MMTYNVQLQPWAARDLDDAYLWAARHAPVTARDWLERFEAALQSLADHPERCSLAPEHRAMKRELREYHFGRKPNVFRAVFIIDGNDVRVLRIRRAARRRLSRRELGEL